MDEEFDVTLSGAPLEIYVKDANDIALDPACFSVELLVAPVNSLEWDTSLAEVSLDDTVSP